MSLKITNPAATVSRTLSRAAQHYPDVPRARDQYSRRVLALIDGCRTGRLGAGFLQCQECFHEELVAFSCRNRHCPRCQGRAAYRWLEKQKDKLLDCHYFHVVFTLPHKLNALIGENQTVCYNILFKSASETLLEFGRNRWQAKPGFTAVLHTWGQNLMPHYHLHCIVSGGGLGIGESHDSWTQTEPGWLFPVRALSRVYRGKYMHYLKKACRRGELLLSERRLEPDDSQFKAIEKKAWAKDWNVFCKRPFKDAQVVLQYLSLYTHRIAISDKRIETIDETDLRVKINYKDYRQNGRRKTLWLSLKTFLSRFMEHILPPRFVKIRHYGLLANRGLKERLHKARGLIAQARGEAYESIDVSALLCEPDDEDPFLCPRCGHDQCRMILLPSSQVLISLTGSSRELESPFPDNST